MAYPFMPMTTEQLKKLIRVNQDSNQTIKSPELSNVFKTDDQKSILEINPQHSEANPSNIRTDNRYKSKSSNQVKSIIWEPPVRSYGSAS